MTSRRRPRRRNCVSWAMAAMWDDYLAIPLNDEEWWR